MAIRTSNSKFFEVLDPIPTIGVGWWLEAYQLSSVNTLLARVLDFQEASFQDVLSDVGLGSVTLSKSGSVLRPKNDDGSINLLPNGADPLTLTTQASWWRVIDNGVERFRWVMNGTQSKPADPDADDSITLTGPGIASALSWGVVLPTGTTAASRIFTGTTAMSVWLTLFAEAKTRGAIPSWFTTTFNASVDSKGDAWPDLGDYEVQPGKDILSLLVEYAESIGFDWHISPLGVLSASVNYGNDVSSTVRFWTGSNIWAIEQDMSATDVKSAVYVEDSKGGISSALSATSAVRWNRREVYVTSGTASDTSGGSTYANGILRTVQSENISNKYTVNYDPVDSVGASLGNRVYSNYKVGDVIGIDAKTTSGSTDSQVVGVTLTINKEGGIDYEMSTVSRKVQLLERLKRLMKAQLQGNYTSGTGITSTYETAQVAASKSASALGLGNLSNVLLTSVANNDTIYYDSVAAKWKNAPRYLANLPDVLLSSPSAGQYLSYDGARWVNVPAPAGAPSVVQITSDTANITVTTMADVAGLVFAMAANTTYKVEGYILFTSAATTTGIRIGLTFPAVTTASFQVEIPVAADGTAGAFQGWLTTSGDSVVGTGVQATATTYIAKITGIIRPSAAGNLQVQAATEVNASAIVVKAYSSLLVTQI